MATRTSRNDTPDTPGVSESKIARMKVDELRRTLKNRGVKNTDELKKPDLVKRLIQAEVEKSSTGEKSSGTSATKSAGRSAAKSPGGSAAESAGASSGRTAAKAGGKSSAKGGKKPASHNDTPNTPEVSESKIARMKASELRTKLADLGVEGTGEMKKPELVERYVKAELKSVRRTKAAASKASGSKASGSKSSGSKGSGSNAPRSSSKASLSKGGGASENAGSSKTGNAAKRGGASKSGNVAKSSSAVKSGNTAKGGEKSGGKRTGKKASKSLDYSQEITSTAVKPERDGRSLVTTDHEVIRQWAKARRAVPSSVAGTQHDGHLGVLRFDFPGYSGDRLVEVSWAEWFEAFDKRRLNFIYQERRSGGERSNFFQLENPDA